MDLMRQRNYKQVITKEHINNVLNRGYIQIDISSRNVYVNLDNLSELFMKKASLSPMAGSKRKSAKKSAPKKKPKKSDRKRSHKKGGSMVKHGTMVLLGGLVGLPVAGYMPDMGLTLENQYNLLVLCNIILLLIVIGFGLEFAGGRSAVAGASEDIKGQFLGLLEKNWIKMQERINGVLGKKSKEGVNYGYHAVAPPPGLYHETEASGYGLTRKLARNEKIRRKKYEQLGFTSGSN